MQLHGSVEAYEPGQVLNVEDCFKEGDLVDIAGNSIGKGFQGVSVRCIVNNTCP